MANKKLKNRLFQQKFDYEEPRHISDEWDRVSGLIDIGYAAIERKNYPVMTENWLRAWEIVMRMVKNSNAPMKLSISALDEATDYEYNLQAWLQDMEMELYNAGEHEKRIWFCEEILSPLDWEYDDDGGFKMAIGESLYALGRTEEGETYYSSSVFFLAYADSRALPLRMKKYAKFVELFFLHFPAAHVTITV